MTEARDWIKQLAADVMRMLDVAAADFVNENGGTRRTREVSDARSILCYVLRHHQRPGDIPARWQEIGNVVGIDHASAMYSVERISDKPNLLRRAREIVDEIAHPATPPAPPQWNRLGSKETELACAEALAEKLLDLPWKELPKEERLRYLVAWKAAFGVYQLATEGT